MSNPITKSVSELLEKIAKKEMRVATLEQRNSDSLDFYDMGVGSMRSALEAAYLAGLQAQQNEDDSEDDDEEDICDNCRLEIEDQSDTEGLCQNCLDEA